MIMDLILGPMKDKKKRNRYRLLFILLSIPLLSFSQSDTHSYSILFYNVENLFDCKNDSLTNDDDFTPEGKNHWTYNRLNTKLNGLSKTMLAINEWNCPDLIGLCEVENQYVLNQLIYNTGLNHLAYKSIHYDSKDRRGIDVALLYRSDKVEILESHPISCSDPKNNFFTRDALYTKGVILDQDTLHLIINHWPSKRGGALASEDKRLFVAEQIKSVTDSILNSNAESNIILLGDFNADLQSESLKQFISNGHFTSVLEPDELITHKVGGSHKYQGHWSVIDHILISRAIATSEKISLNHSIGQLAFLLENDLTYSGLKPKRTYAGPRYIGGISDHLPVILTISKK